MTYLVNKTAGRDVAIKDTYEAGIELAGFEVKSIRQRNGSLKGAHVVVRGGEAWLVGAHIPPFQPANAPEEFDTYRTRKLLLHKREIAELAAAENQSGVAVIPTKLYNTNGRIKLEIGVGPGKKAYDKREDIKRRDTKRDVDRTLKKQPR
ncbi:MAG: SsrA-binding protein SmpB [Candidatus Paceibacterota bacterium]